jgi:hypothetical protein
MRKQILGNDPAPQSSPGPEQLDIAAIATVMVTSEDPDHPVENAFDDRYGPGATHWAAAQPGEQTLILAFDTPQTIRTVTLEIEEQEVSRTQELDLSVSDDGGRTYRELLRQEYNFSPPGTTFQREEWTVRSENVSHLRLRIKPDKGNHPARAKLTSLVLRHGRSLS